MSFQKRHNNNSRKNKQNNEDPSAPVNNSPASGAQNNGSVALAKMLQEQENAEYARELAGQPVPVRPVVTAKPTVMAKPTVVAKPPVMAKPTVVQDNSLELAKMLQSQFNAEGARELEQGSRLMPATASRLNSSSSEDLRTQAIEEEIKRRRLQGTSGAVAGLPYPQKVRRTQPAAEMPHQYDRRLEYQPRRPEYDGRLEYQPPPQYDGLVEYPPRRPQYYPRVEYPPPPPQYDGELEQLQAEADEAEAVRAAAQARYEAILAAGAGYEDDNYGPGLADHAVDMLGRGAGAAAGGIGYTLDAAGRGIRRVAPHVGDAALHLASGTVDLASEALYVAGRGAGAAAGGVGYALGAGARGIGYAAPVVGQGILHAGRGVGTAVGTVAGGVGHALGAGARGIGYAAPVVGDAALHLASGAVDVAGEALHLAGRGAGAAAGGIGHALGAGARGIGYVAPVVGQGIAYAGRGLGQGLWHAGRGAVGVAGTVAGGIGHALGGLGSATAGLFRQGAPAYNPQANYGPPPENQQQSVSGQRIRQRLHANGEVTGRENLRPGANYRPQVPLTRNREAPLAPQQPTAAEERRRGSTARERKQPKNGETRRGGSRKYLRKHRTKSQKRK